MQLALKYGVLPLGTRFSHGINDQRTGHASNINVDSDAILNLLLRDKLKTKMVFLNTTTLKLNKILQK